MRFKNIWIGVLGLFLLTSSRAWAEDPGWPRKLVKPGGTVILYQPQVDEWQDFTDIKWRQAFEPTPTGGKQVVGAATFEGITQNNTDTHMVFISNIKVLNTYFPSQDPSTSAQLDSGESGFCNSRSNRRGRVPVSGNCQYRCEETHVLT